MSAIPCPRCVEPHSAEYIHAEDAEAYLPGEICLVPASVDAPVLSMLRNEPSSSSSQSQSTLTTQSTITASHTSTHRRRVQHGRELGLKQRPCIISKPMPSMSEAGSTIYYMATLLGEEDITKLPRILQRLCVPVSPHVLTSDTNRPHIHTYPEWLTRNVWIIARAVIHQAAISHRWENRSSATPRKSSFKLEDEELAALMDIAERIEEEWDAVVQADPTAADRHLREYLDMRSNANKKHDARQRRQIHSRNASAPHTPKLVTPPPELVTYIPPTEPSGATKEVDVLGVETVKDALSALELTVGKDTA